MTWYDYTELTICIGLYIPLGFDILRGRVKQNFATWSLWALLDAIVAASIIFQHGNFTAVTIYACSGTVISLCILKSKNFEWKWFETLVACLAIICMVVWTVSGPRDATIASTSAVMVASLPLIRDAYRKPWEHSILTWFGFLIVNILATIQGKRWSVEERLYPSSCAVLCLLLFALTMQKFWIHEPVAGSGKPAPEFLQ